ncbi:hypothetical protein GL218_08064 [Daldinia childiae]|uniref:uncharacterized protein n=1 Tax=Daldinia childiae TaxID=326645 RepID=UPI0014481C91|nr:uncharacterized protein GL218_08064 [Daldinia childiae]KAF3069072.1 hypothetical protein GL218_08064 [Daldinia childiae]
MAFQNNIVPQSPLQWLPIDIKIDVMEALDITSLYALVTTCKDFYNIQKKYGGIILRTITTNALGDALPSAMALHAARLTEWVTELPAYSDDELVVLVHNFGRRYLNRNEIWINPQDFSFPMAWELISFHRIVEHFAEEFMEDTLSDTYLRNSRDNIILEPTSTEIARVQLTFYCMEISRELLPFHVTGLNGGEGNELSWQMLWHYFAPWENRIAEEITDFLDKYLGNAICQGSINMRQGDVVYNSWYAATGLRGFDKLADDEVVSLNTADIETSPEVFRRKCYFAPGVSGFTWLRPVSGDLMVRSFNIDHLLATFPQKENGACDNWYFTIVSEQHNPLYADSELLPWETAWWDRARINTVFPGILPSIAEIQDMAEGNEYTGGIFEPDVDYCAEIGY